MEKAENNNDNHILKKPDNFAQFECRYIIKGTITNISQLHVGAGGAETEFSIDNPLIRLKIRNTDVPYIPGSSLKGIFRNEIEKYLKAQEKTKETLHFQNVCYVYDNKNSCNTKEIENICLACRIFGNSQIGSHIIVSDAILNMDYFPGVKNKTGIAINRITGATQRGALYDVETLQPGGIFNFELQIININLKENNVITRAIKFLLKELLEGWIYVGGKRSTGLGKIKVEDAKIMEIRPETLHEFSKLQATDLNIFLGEL